MTHAQSDTIQTQGGQGGWGPPPGAPPPGGQPPGGQGGWGQPPGGQPPGGQGGWGQPPGGQPPGGQGGWGQPPGGQPPSGQAWGPPPGGGAPAGGATTFDEVVANFKLLMQRGNPALIQAYIALALASALFALPSIIIGLATLSAFHSGSLAGAAGFGALGFVFGIVRFVGAMLIGVLYYGITRTQRALLFEGPQAVAGGVQGVLKRATENFGMLLIGCFISGLVIALGVIGCGVGVLVTAFLFGMTPYLIANGMSDIGAALKRSYELALRNVTPLILCILVMCAGIFVFWAIGAVAALIGSALGTIVYGIVSFVFLIAATAFQFVLAQFMSAAHISIEAADAQIPVVR